jgi:phosphatidate cytidylyltransferase
VLTLRVLTGLVAVPVLLFATLDSGWLFLVVLFATGLLGTGEALWMVRQAGQRPIAVLSLLLSITILADAALAAGRLRALVPGLAAPDRLLAPAVGLAALAALVVLLVRSDHRGSLADWALTLALPLYVAGLLQFFIPLRSRDDAAPLTWPMLVLLTSWSCDIAAYFAGRAFGRRRLSPSISPSKSVEGALAGIAAATIVGGLFSLAVGGGPPRLAGFGLAVGLGSVLGDLAESLLKRQCGVKDSGFLMPGHGGILDRMDALLFSAAFAYVYLQATTT